MIKITYVCDHCSEEGTDPNKYHAFGILLNGISPVALPKTRSVYVSANNFSEGVICRKCIITLKISGYLRYLSGHDRLEAAKETKPTLGENLESLIRDIAYEEAQEVIENQ